MSDYPAHFSFRELDQQSGRAKGSAFKAFKRLEAQLRCPQDYQLLHAVEDAALIAKLKAEARIYPSSVQVVLLGPQLGKVLLAQLLAAPEKLAGQAR